jgi:prophage regulatory protein
MAEGCSFELSQTARKPDYFKPITKTRTSISFGAYPEVTLKTARERKVEAKELLAEGMFHKPVSLGDRAVAWVEEEIHDWIEDKISQRQSCQMSFA